MVSRLRKSSWSKENPLMVNNHQYDAFVEIHNPDPNAGLSVLMTYALNGVRNALKRNWLPVINFNNKKQSYFYDPSVGENIWEYFWHPVLGPSSKELHDLLDNGYIDPNLVKRFEKKEIFYWHLKDPDRIATFWHKTPPVDKDKWIQEKRSLGRKYVSRFINIRQEIVEKANKFASLHFDGSYLISAHIRGTDWSYAKPTNYEDYFKEIDILVKSKSLKNFQVFLATDQKQFVTIFEKRFGKKLITYESARGDSFIAPFKLPNIPVYKKGEDVLIDILLLSRGDHLIKSAASVGEYATWFNPHISITDFAFGSQYVTENHFLAETGFEKLLLAKNPIKRKLFSLKRYTRNYIESKIFRFDIEAWRNKSLALFYIKKVFFKSYIRPFLKNFKKAFKILKTLISRFLKILKKTRFKLWLNFFIRLLK